MRALILTFSFLFILRIGYSQNSDFKKNEISLGIINQMKSPKDQESFFINSYYIVPLYNFIYKRFINDKNAIRLSYYRPINKSYNNPIGGGFSDGKYKEQVLKIGYEYRFKPKRFIPYIAIDFSYLNSSSLNEFGGGIAGSFNSLERQSKGYGLSPTIGVNYKIHKNIFIGLESNLRVLLLKEDKISSSKPMFTDPIEITKNQSKYFEFVFNPIAFTAIFSF